MNPQHKLIAEAIKKKRDFLVWILKKDVPDPDKLVNQLGVNVAIQSLDDVTKEIADIYEAESKKWIHNNDVSEETKPFNKTQFLKTAAGEKE